MTRELISQIIQFILLVLAQIFVLNQVNFSGYINPYLYVVFILSMPFETPKWLLLSTSFLLGFLIDVFSGFMGLHTAASVAMAFCRPGVLRFVSTKDIADKGGNPSMAQLGFNWFFSYSFILVLVHHFTLFYLEVFRFTGFFHTLLRCTLSIAITLVFIFVYQFFFYPSRKKE